MFFFKAFGNTQGTKWRHLQDWAQAKDKERTT